MEKKFKKIVAMRGRPLSNKRTEYGKSIRGGYEKGLIKEQRKNMQRLEPRNDGICNTITTVQKDTLYLGKVKVMETEEKTIEDYLYKANDGNEYGIFKLSPRECGRLMNVEENDIDKMFSVNSASQCYKQFGNSIVVSVLMAIFSQLGIAGVKKWNDLTDDERYRLILKGCVTNGCNDDQN